MGTSRKKLFNHRAFISVGLSLSLVILFVTAVLIQFFENDPDSLPMHISVSCHALAGILFILLNGLHLKLNWQAFRLYLQDKRKAHVSGEAIYAVLLVIGFIVVGTFVVYLIMG